MDTTPAFNQLKATAADVISQYIETSQSFAYEDPLTDTVLKLTMEGEKDFDIDVILNLENLVTDLVSFFLVPENNQRFTSQYGNKLHPHLPSLQQFFKELQNDVNRAQLTLASVAWNGESLEQDKALRHRIQWYTRKLEEAKALKAIHQNHYGKQ